MINYDKNLIKDQLEIEDIFQLLLEFGGEPEYTSFGMISATICHNMPGEGSRKLYYYSNSGLFICYTGCEEPHFDIFELVKKVGRIQWHEDYNLNDCVRWVARRFGIAGITEDGEEKNQLEDWKKFAEYENLKEDEISLLDYTKLKEYDSTILDRFNYSIKLSPWIKEGISQQVISFAEIGYYPGEDQITIPHFDMDNRFVGLRGRTMCKNDAEQFGKYRPMRVNKLLYSHPLGCNLYGLNWAKDNIKIFKSAVVFESEKSVLKYMSYFGIENNISVATCGSSLSQIQMKLLLDLGVQEIIIAFDRQYQKIGDDEYKRWVKKLKHINEKYSKYCRISFMFDTKNLLGYKDSPIDCGKDTFLKLFKGRLDGEGK